MMKIVKRLCAVVLIGCLFLCGSGFSNKYEDVQIIELESNSSTGFWSFEILGDLEDRGKVEILRVSEHDKKDNSICCSVGKDIFSIRGIKEGKVGLDFAYYDNNVGKDYRVKERIFVLVHVNKFGHVKILKYENIKI